MNRKCFIECLESRQLLAVDFELLKDINSSSADPFVERFTRSGPYLYFINSLSDLWRTDAGSDASSGGTVLLKRGGVQSMTDVNGTLFFAGADSHGWELWKSDGTTAGTVLVRDIDPTGSSNPGNLANVGGVLYFSASRPGEGTELWKSDGSVEGTQLVKDMVGGSVGSDPDSFTECGGVVYFTANNPATGRELYKTSGTAATTQLVSDIAIGSGSSSPLYLTNVAGTLFFSARRSGKDVELWKTNGTADSTQQVRDIRAGAAGSYPHELLEFQGQLVFAAFDGVGGSELWKSNGTSAGTFRMKDIVPGAAGSYPSHLTKLNNVLYFAAGRTIRQLYRSGGTAASTVAVTNFAGGVEVVYALEGFVYMQANDGLLGSEVWRSAGTAQSTTLVADINPGSGDAFLSPLFAGGINGSVVFMAYESTFSRQLFVSRGTPATTVRLSLPVVETFSGIQRPDGTMVEHNGTLYFEAASSFDFNQLWKTDGTSSGTDKIRRFTAQDRDMREAVSFAGSIFFVAGDRQGYELWRSDGTKDGTLIFKDLFPVIASSDPVGLTIVGEKLYFTARNRLANRQVWVTDGTLEGTVRLTNFSGGPGADATKVVAVGSTVYFTVRTDSDELWKSDGTIEGTVRVKRFESPQSALGDLTVVGQQLFFKANDNVRGQELWRLGASDAVPVLVKDIRSGAAGSNLSSFTEVNGRLFFVADDGVNGLELWKSDGTTVGTLLVRNLRTASESSAPRSLINVNGVLHFAADNGIVGEELWRSDGSFAGTYLLKDVQAGAGSSNIKHMTNLQGRLYFTADDGVHGGELWSSNGLTSGTQIVVDLNPGEAGSDPGLPILYDGRLVMNALVPAFGREIWIESRTLPASAALSFGDDGPSTAAPHAEGEGLALVSSVDTRLVDTRAVDARAVDTRAVDLVFDAFDLDLRRNRRHAQHAAIASMNLFSPG